MSSSPTPTASPFRQPKAVWAVAFACVISFMGIGLVDPILPALASQLHAGPSQVELLFTSYLVITAVAMLVTGWVSTRIGAKRTLLAGLVLIVCCSALAGASGGIGQIVGFRAGWGLGNALFIATSLAVIVASASGGFAGAIVLYETALGVGIAMGPLVGGELGAISWRMPFFGVAVLMGLAMVATFVLLEPTPRPAHRTSLADPVKALRHRGLLTLSLMALAYNWGFFTLLAYTPFPMNLGAHQLGYVFTGWGLFVGFFAVFGAPRLQARFGTVRSLYGSYALMALDLLVIALFTSSQLVLVVAVVVSGAFIGINNTLVTQSVMTVSTVERPVASAAYNFVRFIGGGLAPFFAGKLAERFDVHAPFFVGAAALVVAMLVLASGASLVTRAERAAADEVVAAEPPAEGVRQPALRTVAATSADSAGDHAGPAPVVVAVDRSPHAGAVTAAAARLATLLASPVELLHVQEPGFVEDQVADLETHDEAVRTTREAVGTLGRAGVQARGHVLVNGGTHASVGRLVAEHANRWGARVLVVGPPTHGPVSSLLAGSATEEMWRTADCNVLLVKRALPGGGADEADVSGTGAHVGIAGTS